MTAGPCKTPFPSVWLSELETTEPHTPINARVPTVVDIAIVGAGMTGCSLALHLSMQGNTDSVLVIDARCVSGGASGRNGGILWPARDEPFEVRTARRLRELLHSIGADAFFVEGGGVSLVERAEEVDEAFVLDGQEEVEPELLMGAASGAFSRAYLDHDVVAFWPACAVRAIASAAAPKTTFALGCAVESISDGGSPSRVILRTARGDISCGRVVVATDGWLPRLCPELAPHFRSYTNTVLCSRAPITLRGQQSGWPVAAFSCGEGASEVYGCRRADGRLILGGLRDRGLRSVPTATEDDDTAPGHEETAELLKSWFAQRFPAVNLGEGWGDAWLGVLGFTADGQPLMGRLPGHNGRVFVCGGFCGHGMPRCFGLADILAKRLCGKPLDDLEESIERRFDVGRFFAS